MPENAKCPSGGGRVAMVTGATGIIGPGICRVLRREGWRVAACGISDQAFAQHARIFGEIEADARFAADLNGRDTCHDLVHQVQSRLGPVALLVNNAATNPVPTQLSEVDEPYADMMIQVNLLAPLWLSQAAEPSLIQQRGSIVNISSVRVCRPSANTILYPVTKAAMESLTIALAMQLGPRGVRVNAVRVGVVPGAAFMMDELERLPTEAARRLMAEILPRHGEHEAKVLSTTGAAGTPAGVAEAVAFLASERAAFCNAAILPMEGGFTFRTDEPPAAPGEWDSKRAVTDWLKREGYIE